MSLSFTVLFEVDFSCELTLLIPLFYVVNFLNRLLPPLAAAFTDDFLSLLLSSLKVDKVADKIQQFSAKFKTINMILFCDDNTAHTQSSIHAKIPKIRSLYTAIFRPSFA